MWLFYLTVPLMVVAIGAAAVPLLLTSRREITQLAREEEMKVELRRRRHGLLGHGRPARPHRPAAQRPAPHDHDAWYRPVQIERS